MANYWVTSSFLLLVVRPGAPSSVFLVQQAKSRCFCEITRLGDLGNELTEVKKSETRLRQLLEQKEME